MYSGVIENNFKSTALAVNHRRNCTGQSPYLIIKSDYTVIEERMKISHCLTIKHQVDVFILHHLAMGTNTCFHHPLPIPFSIALSPIPSSLRRSILYMPWCSILHRETIWGEIMLSWALALWNITKNWGCFAGDVLLPTQYFSAWLLSFFFLDSAHSLHPPLSFFLQSDKQQVCFRVSMLGAQLWMDSSLNRCDYSGSKVFVCKIYCFFRFNHATQQKKHYEFHDWFCTL